MTRAGGKFFFISLFYKKIQQQQFKPKREPGVKCDDKNLLLLLLLHIHHHQPGNLAVASQPVYIEKKKKEVNISRYI